MIEPVSSSRPPRSPRCRSGPLNPFVAVALAAVILSPTFACSTGAKPPPPLRLVSAGERIARANCGACHALTTAQDSPLGEAPAFPALRSRYDRDAMAQVLEERMIVIHPRMPRLRLEEDQLTAFLDYWAAIAPPPSR